MSCVFCVLRSHTTQPNFSSGSTQKGFHQTGSETRVGRASVGLLRGLQLPHPTDFVYFSTFPFSQGSAGSSLFLRRKRAVWSNGKPQRFSTQEAAGGTSPQPPQMHCVHSHCTILHCGSSPTEPVAEHHGSSTTAVPRPWGFPVQLWSDSLQEAYLHSR